MIAGQLELQLFADVARIRADMEKAKGIVDKGAVAMQRALSMVSTAFAALGVGAAGAGLLGMIKQINAGVDALNDLKDATGSSIENISALERVERLFGHAAGTAGNTLVKFNQALGQTMKSGSDAEKVLQALGLRAEDLRKMDPAEALQQTAIALSRFADDGNKARAVQELFGKSLKEMAPFLKDLAESGRLQATVTTEQAAEAEKFAREWDKLTNSATEFGRSVANVVVPRINEVIEKLRTADRQGESLFITLAKMGALPVPPWVALIFKGAANAMGDRDPRAEAAKLQKLLETDTSLTASERASYAAQIEVERRRAYVPFEGGFVGSTPRSINLPIEDKEAEAQAKKAAAAAKKELEDQAKLIAELHGLSGSFAEDWDRLNRIFGKGAITLDQLTTSQAKLLAQQPFAKEQAKAEEEALKLLVAEMEDEAKVMAEVNDILNKVQQTRADHILAAQEQLKTIEFETAALTMTNLQREKAIALRELEKTGIDKQSEAYRKLAADISAAVEHRETTRETKQFGEDLRSDMRGAMTRAFEDSKNPAKAFIEAFASTMYTRLTSKLSDAILDGLLGKPGTAGGGLLAALGGGSGGLRALFGGTSFGSSGFGSGLAYGNQDLGQFLHSGGIVGGTPSFYRGINHGVFNGAPRFHTGGIAGDEVPIIAKRGEGVFTPAQMRALGGGGGPNVTVHQNFQVGESVTPSALREELKLAQRRAEAGLRRAAKYGTEGS